jgi:hypothetical protein
VLLWLVDAGVRANAVIVPICMNVRAKSYRVGTTKSLLAAAFTSTAPIAERFARLLRTKHSLTEERNDSRGSMLHITSRSIVSIKLAGIARRAG